MLSLPLIPLYEHISFVQLNKKKIGNVQGAEPFNFFKIILIEWKTLKIILSFTVVMMYGRRRDNDRSRTLVYFPLRHLLATEETALWLN